MASTRCSKCVGDSCEDHGRKISINPSGIDDHTTSIKAMIVGCSGGILSFTEERYINPYHELGEAWLQFALAQMEETFRKVPSPPREQGIFERTLLSCGVKPGEKGAWSGLFDIGKTEDPENFVAYDIRNLDLDLLHKAGSLKLPVLHHEGGAGDARDDK